jgi:hypothetical protein
LELKGFSRPVEAYEVIALHQEGVSP